MKLLRLTLTDFRNYQRCVWRPTSPLVVLYGDNGSGKTNLLEALSLLAPGRGLHGAPAAAYARRGTTQWGVAALLQRGEHVFRLATGSAPSGRKRRVFMLDDEPVRTQAIIAEHYACVWLAPQMDRLLSEGAAQRRRFLDRLVAALMPGHAQELAAHDRSVMERNRVLATDPGQTAWLSALEDSISRHAVAMTAARLLFLERLKALAVRTAGFPRLEMHLDCALAERLAHRSALEVEDDVRERLEKSRSYDQQRGSTQFGAHRADFSLRDQDHDVVGAMASSGQQKIMLLSLLLSHAHCVADGWGEPPMLLLDEPLVHLDDHYRHALMNNLQERQIPAFLTGTDAASFAPLKESADFVQVRSGFLHPRTP